MSSGYRNEPTFVFPFWLVVVLSLEGIVAFLLVGLFGYPDDPRLLGNLLEQPWPLYVWFCSVWLAIFGRLLWHRSLRHMLVWLWSVLVLLMVVLGLGWYLHVFESLTKSLVTLVQATPTLAIIVCVATAVVLMIALIVARVTVALRHPIFFLVIIVGLVAFLLASDVIARFLHYSVAGTGDERSALGHSLLLSGLALTTLIVGCLSMSFALGLSLFRQKPMQLALQLAQVVFIVSYTLVPALSGINAVLWIFNVTTHNPFFEPGVGSVMTIAVFVILGVIRARAVRQLFA